MKKFKKLFCFMLVFLSVFFVACKKPAEPNNQGGGDSSDPPSYESIKTLDVLNTTSTKLTTILTTEKNGVKFSEKYASSFYNNFIATALEILSKVASTTGLQEEIVVKGNAVAVEGNSSVSKIEKFYLKNKRNANKHIIDLTILASKKNYESNPLNYILFDYDIEYDASSEDIIFSCRIQNSMSNTDYVGELTSSDCVYYFFNFDTRYNNLEANHFKRTGNFDFSNESYFESNLITNYIMNYDCILLLNFEKIYPQVSSDLNLKAEKEARDAIKTEINTHKQLLDSVTELQVTDTIVNNLSENIIPVMKNFA